MISLFILSTIVPTMLILINSLINKKNSLSREKLSPFECGFDPMNSARLPFSIRFYLVALIFLIFDIEITLIMPIPIIFNMNSQSYWIFLSTFFLILLLAGLYHEWNQGALNWAY